MFQFLFLRSLNWQRCAASDCLFVRSSDRTYVSVCHREVRPSFWAFGPAIHYFSTPHDSSVSWKRTHLDDQAFLWKCTMHCNFIYFLFDVSIKNQKIKPTLFSDFCDGCQMHADISSLSIHMKNTHSNDIIDCCSSKDARVLRNQTYNVKNWIISPMPKLTFTVLE